MRRTALVIVALLALVPASAHAAFPGRNGAIVYGWRGSDGGRFELGLWTTSATDGSRAPLLGCEGSHDDSVPIPCGDVGYADPAVSPDGRAVVFDAGSSLAIVDFDGTGLQLLPPRSADDGEPAFSPDGSRIVFTAGRSLPGRHARELWISDRSGTNAHRLPVVGRAPTWSTRNWIAFARRGQVYRIRPSGRGLQRITTHGGTAPAWSPDGRKLAYVDRFRPADPLTTGIAVMTANADGTRRRPILRGEMIYDVAWSPDSRWLLVVGDFTGLLVVDLKGRVRHRFYGGTEAHAEQDLWTYGIDWQPLPLP